MYTEKEGRIKVARLLGMHAHAYPNELRICFDLKHKYRSVELLDAMSYNINSKIFKSSIWPEINFIRSKSNLFITTIRFVMSVIFFYWLISNMPRYIATSLAAMLTTRKVIVSWNAIAVPDITPNKCGSAFHKVSVSSFEYAYSHTRLLD